jgi:hypothetical protein
VNNGRLPREAGGRECFRPRRFRYEKGKGMKRILLGFVLFLPLLLITEACDTSLSVGRKTIGIRSWEFIYTDGYLRTTYPFPLEKVWSACIKTLIDLNPVDGEQDRKIATGKLTAFIQDEKVQILVDYVEKQITSVSIMVGPSGSALGSQLIHDRIAAVLKNL